jgi:hypothetical protein
MELAVDGQDIEGMASMTATFHIGRITGNSEGFGSQSDYYRETRMHLGNVGFLEADLN